MKLTRADFDVDGFYIHPGDLKTTENLEIEGDFIPRFRGNLDVGGYLYVRGNLIVGGYLYVRMGCLLKSLDNWEKKRGRAFEFAKDAALAMKAPQKAGQ